MGILKQLPESSARLHFLIKFLKTNGLQFAKQINVSQSFISGIISGRSKISAALVDKISQKFPFVNVHWLLTGEGSIVIKDGPGVPHTVHDEPSQEKNFLNDAELRRILAGNLVTIAAAWGMKKKELFSLLLPEVSKQTLTNYYNGSSQPPLSALVELEKITGVPVSALLTTTIRADILPSRPLPEKGGIFAPDWVDDEQSPTLTIQRSQ